METAYCCNACGMGANLNSAKCEHCNCPFLDEDEDSNLMDEWEDDFRFIEQAELKGKIYTLNTLEEAINNDDEKGTTETIPMQPIKSEPEIQIDCEANDPQVEDEVDDDHNLLHEDENHGDDMESVLKGFLEYNQYEKTFTDSLNLEIHKEEHRKLVQDNVQSTDQIQSVNTQRIEVAKIFTCVICYERFPLNELLTDHIKLAHKDKESALTIVHRINNQLTYTCKLCGKISASKKIHSVHLKSHTRDRSFECEMCGMKFATQSTVKCHKRLHSVGHPYKCPIGLCTKSYRHKGDMNRHVKRQHESNPKPFSCDFCDSKFFAHTMKMDHERLVHTYETPYQCPMCDESFAVSRRLNNHLRLTHNVVTNFNRRVQQLIPNDAAAES